VETLRDRERLRIAVNGGEFEAEVLAEFDAQVQFEGEGPKAARQFRIAQREQEFGGVARILGGDQVPLLDARKAMYGECLVRVGAEPRPADGDAAADGLARLVERRLADKKNGTVSDGPIAEDMPAVERDFAGAEARGERDNGEAGFAGAKGDAPGAPKR